MSIYEKLFNWQQKIVNKYKDRTDFGIWLDMGLGKTPISLSFAEINNCSKVLVITINSKIEDSSISGSFANWILNSNIKYNLHYKTDKEFNFKTDGNDFFIVNYEYLFKRKKTNERNSIELRKEITDFINSCKGHNLAIIIDESHKMKDQNSTQTKCINKIKKLALLKASNVYSYLLTGTPFTQGYIDLYSQLKFLGYESSKQDFKDAFCVIGNLKGLMGWQQPIVGYKNIDGLYRVIHRYAITIKTDEVEDLPDQVHIPIKQKESELFNLFIHEKIKGKEIKKELEKRNVLFDLNKYNTDTLMNNPFYRNIDYPEQKYVADTPGNFWLRARQLSIGFQGNSKDYCWYDKTRLEELEFFLENNPDNYILFYNYTPELYEIFDICEKLKYNIDIFSGEIKSLYFYEKYQSQSPEEKFINKKNIILANFASGSTGKNWQEYNKCIIFSIPVYKDYSQGIKRIHRLGQKETVIYYHFYQSNFLDYGMKKALDERIDYNINMFQSDLKNNGNLLNKAQIH